MIRVLIADDHELLRSGLRAMLDAQDDIEVLGEAADGAEAIEQAIRLRPDVVTWTSACRGWTASRPRGDCRLREARRGSSC